MVREPALHPLSCLDPVGPFHVRTPAVNQQELLLKRVIGVARYLGTLPRHGDILARRIVLILRTGSVGGFEQVVKSSAGVPASGGVAMRGQPKERRGGFLRGWFPCPSKL